MRILKLRNFCLLFCCACIAFPLFLLPVSLTANAMSDNWYPPTCEVSFEETSATLISKSTEIAYNDKNASLKTTYKFDAATPTELNCYLPVYCRQFEVTDYDASLSLNGTLIAPSYSYSSMFAVPMNCNSFSEILALREQLSQIDDNIMVHEFIVSASEEANFSFSLQETDHILYSFNRHSYTTATRTYDVTVSTTQSSSFIVFGSKPILNASETCSINYTEKSLDDYITEMVDFMKEMTNGVDCTDIITHKVNEFLTSNYKHSSDLFLDTCSKYSYAFLDYNLTLPAGESIIIVEQSMAVGLNSLFNPKVYVGKIYSPAQIAPLSFSVTTEQFVVDSTLTLKNNTYSGDAAESITIAFCEVPNPDLINGTAPIEWEPWRIAVVTVCGIIGVASIVGFIISLIKWKKSK